MHLNVQIHGSGDPLIIMHGLFGTLENWGSQIKVLAEHFTVYAVDLRNHGRSPHCNKICYPLMAADIIEMMDSQGLEKAHITRVRGAPRAFGTDGGAPGWPRHRRRCSRFSRPRSECGRAPWKDWRGCSS